MSPHPAAEQPKQAWSQPVSEQRRPWGPILGAVLAVEVLVAGLLCAPLSPVGSFNDDAVYLGQARQFLLTGDLISSASDPLGQVCQYMPGDSIWLALWLWLSHNSLAWLHAVGVVCTVATAFLLFRLACLSVDRDLALLVAAAFALNPVTLVYSSTLMSEAPFFLVTAAALLLTERLPGGAGPSALVPGLLLGISVLLRMMGLAGAVACVLGLLLTGRRRESVWLGLGVALLVAPYFALMSLATGHSHMYVMQARDALSQGGLSPWSYLGHWAARSWGILQEGYVAAGTLGSAVAAAVILAAGAGSWRQVRSRGLGPLVLFVPVSLGAHLFFPFVWDRYFILMWGLGLLFAALGLPRRLAGGLLLVVLACALGRLPALLRGAGESRMAQPQREAVYDWLRSHTSADSVLLSEMNARTYCLTGRHSVATLNAPDWCELVAEMCRHHASWLLLEGADFGSSVNGAAQVPLPERADLWADASSLMRVRFSSPWACVYQLQVPPGRYLAAYGHYLAALQAEREGDTSRARQEALAALREVPDFPEARTHLAEMMLQQDAGTSSALTALADVVSRYPMDEEAVSDLADAFVRGGRRADADRLLQYGREWARREGMASLQARYEARRMRLSRE